VLNVAGLVAGYPGGGPVLEGIDLHLDEGECVALMGRNGMGKTTLLRTIVGHLRPSAGRIAFAGHDIAGLAPFAIANAGIAYVPQGREIFADFSVEENLLMGVIGKGYRHAAVPETIYARFPILAERLRQRAGTLSGGEQQQLAFARAIAGRPRLLLLDEPAEGVQPSIVHALARIAAEIARQEKISILLVEQNIDLVRALTTRCLFMENGTIADTVPTTKLGSDPLILDRYLSV
jgi:branched-chain amino acid transport system ATP-binding protein/urea transport system ATP-binding protein